jgi:hypothetical protein
MFHVQAGNSPLKLARRSSQYENCTWRSERQSEDLRAPAAAVIQRERAVGGGSRRVRLDWIGELVSCMDDSGGLREVGGLFGWFIL